MSIEVKSFREIAEGLIKDAGLETTFESHPIFFIQIRLKDNESSEYRIWRHNRFLFGLISKFQKALNNTKFPWMKILTRNYCITELSGKKTEVTAVIFEASDNFKRGKRLFQIIIRTILQYLVGVK